MGHSLHSRHRSQHLTCINYLHALDKPLRKHQHYPNVLKVTQVRKAVAGIQTQATWLQKFWL